MIELRDETTLPEILAAIGRERLDRPVEEIRAALETPDYLFGETMKNRLEAFAPDGAPLDRKVWARMSLMPRHIYQYVTEDREVDLIYRDSFGTQKLSPAQHRAYDLVERDAVVGKVDLFRNIGFVFTNPEPSHYLAHTEFEGRRWWHYQADSIRSWWKSAPYTVTTDAETGALAALSMEGPGWFLPRRRLKLFQPLDDTLIAMLMAAHHGLVFRSS
ncbi:MAG: hypothetical protein KDM63_05490 [Verrucomicrobiae bacterium]|nr:hypothetical protein [Verrucomicrobiae bacterium]